MEGLTKITSINSLPGWYLTAFCSLWHCTPVSLERITARAKLGWFWRVHVWPEAPLLGAVQGHCKLPKHKAPLYVTSATLFAKRSVKSRIMSGSTSESMSISLWCDLAKPYHVPKTDFWWIHITLMFMQWIGRTQGMFCSTGNCCGKWTTLTSLRAR